MGHTYRIGQVAALTGVSVRALHHYDRIGLLQPSSRSENGHRRYGELDLLRLQQILTLRYLGFPLRQIGTLLDRPDFDLVASLRIQRGALRDRIAELERIEAALGDLVEQRLATGHWDWKLVTDASATVHRELERKGETQMAAYYSPEEMKNQFEELAAEVTPEGVRQIEQSWAALLAEIRANYDLDPASARAQELAARWNTLREETFRGRRKLMETVAHNYQEGVYADQQAAGLAPSAEDSAFVQRAIEAGKRTGSGG